MAGRPRGRLLLGALVALRALLAADPAAAEPDRAILRLLVNEVPRQEVIVILREGDVLARVADLERAGLQRLAGRRESVGGEPWVSLASLAPGVRFRLDEAGLALGLTAQPEHLEPTVRDLHFGRPPDLVYTDDPSAFLSAAVTWVDFARFRLAQEAGLSIGNTLLFGTATRDEEGQLARGVTTFTLDDRSRLLRWSLGDRFASTGGLGGSAQVGGLSLSREFGLDPYFIRFPTLGLSGATLTRSTAEVYVNGHLVRREQLPPGPFELRNLPMTAGAGAARVVLRDAFGREQVIGAPFYFTSALLRPGLHDFSYDLGFEREPTLTGIGEYGAWRVLGRHRVGVTEDLAAGGRLELASGLLSGGPALTARLPLGEVEVAGAGSRGQDRTGWAASAGYTYTSRPLSLGAAVRALSDHYTTVGLKAPADRPQIELTAFVGVPLGNRASASLQYGHTDFRDRDPADRVSALLNVRLTGRSSFFVTATHSRQQGVEPATEVFAGLTYFLGSRTTASLTHQHGSDRYATTLEVHRPLPLGEGVGYRLQATRIGEKTTLVDPGAAGELTTTTTWEDRYEGAALAQYQGRLGRLEAAYENRGGQGTTALTAAASLVAVGGGLHLSRPVNESFALIRVPGVPGVRGYLNNQEVGRTDFRGDLLVPGLLPYSSNRLGIADQDVPIEYEVAATSRLVAPPPRGGSVAAFPARRVQALMGSLRLERGGALVTPANGQLRVTAAGKPHESPIGGDGEFYLEDVPPGRHQAVVEHKGTRCPFTLEVPESPAPLADLGTVRCVMR